jgi:hypothetical protein
MMQQELLAEYAAQVDVVSVDGNKRYIFSDGRWSDNRPSYLDENDRPVLDDFDKTEVAEQAPTSAPAWMFAGSQLSIDDYNLLLVTTKAAIWIVFISVFALVTLNDKGDEIQAASLVGGLVEIYGMILFAVFPFFGAGLIVWLSTRVVQPALPIVAYLMFAMPFIWLYRSELRGMTKSSRDNEPATIKESCDAKTC